MTSRADKQKYDYRNLHFIELDGLTLNMVFLTLNMPMQFSCSNVVKVTCVTFFFSVHDVGNSIFMYTVISDDIHIYCISGFRGNDIIHAFICESITHVIPVLCLLNRCTLLGNEL